MEVFCKDCEHFSHWLIGAEMFEAVFDTDTRDKCKHPRNITYRNQYDKKEKAYLAEPSELNRYNNCPYFKKKLSILALLLKR